MTADRAAGGLSSSIRWIRSVPGRLFPPSCALCGDCVEAARAPVCAGCWSRLPRAVPPRCGRCGAPGPRFADDVSACGECLEWPDGLDRARAPFLMQGGAAGLVRSLKYRGWTALAARMGTAMVPSARQVAGDGGGTPAEGPRLVPVPLSPARLRRRGFNQAALLAGALGRELGWPVATALRRTARGRRQARLGGASRRENVRGLFRGERPVDLDVGTEGRTVAPRAVVVDDVVTTGSTAAACAEALAGAGWHPLGVVAFARAVTGPSTAPED